MADAAITATTVPAVRALDPLAGRYAGGPGVTLAPVGPRPQVSLRTHPEARGAMAEALGIALPERPKTSASGDGLAALWLGPDEWLLVADAASGRTAAGLVAAAEGATPDQSAVDVSDRFVAVAVEGMAAEAVLAAGCPQDLRLRTFPVGAASRTLLAKAEVILWRRGETRFEVFLARSFADYGWLFLAEAARCPAL